MYLFILLHFLSYINLHVTLIHTNEFAVLIHGPQEKADTIAQKYGFVNKGQIGSLEGYYLFEHHHIKKRSVEPNVFHSSLLQNDSLVMWFEQQVIKSRVKRSKGRRELPNFIDPLFPEQWFLYEGAYHHYDMNVYPAWEKGYTGKGIVVSILDDGIQGNHPDLAINYDKEASLDINDNDDDPSPQDNDDNKHGTRCAGEVAAVANNEFCGVGVAYNARIGGVRMLDGSVTDCIEAAALSLKPNYIHIYSASWGPEDDGKTVDGPGNLAKIAFEDGIKKGRQGLGSIFVWASGNGGKYDNCNCDGYTNSIYTVSISSATQSSLKPWYLEECSSTLATTYSSGETDIDANIVTIDVSYDYFTDVNHENSDYSNLCTRSHTGTSASAPIAAGICALALEANRNLSWRDMQYIIVLTSRYTPLNREDGWIKNGVGRKVSTKFGYGLMDGEAMVTVASSWKTLPAQHVCFTTSDETERTIPFQHGETLEVSMYTDGCKNTDNDVKYIEHVQVKITLTFHPRGNLHIILVSPAGTPSPVLLPRILDRKEGSFSDWPFMSVHFWGESTEGTWKLIISNKGSLIAKTPGKLRSWSLIFYGTSNLPEYLINHSQNTKGNEHPHPTRGLSTSLDPDKSSTLFTCKSLGEFLVISEDDSNYCSISCPSGMYGSKVDSICHRCDKSCFACYGPSYNNCLACSSKYFLLNSVCVKSCPDGYFTNSHSNICFPCLSSCSACEGSANKCTLCKKELRLYKSRCVRLCPSGTYQIERSCPECSSECTDCIGPLNSLCLECSDGFFLLNTSCLPECPKGFFANSERKCVNCHRSCESCNNAFECISCNKNYKFNKDHTTCEFIGCTSMHPYSKCHSNCGHHCSSCFNEDCEICKRDYLWVDGLCMHSCPLDTYRSNDECNSCFGKCVKCDNDPYNCTSCAKNYYFYENRCLAVCPDGYYADSEYICQKCHPLCEKCFGATSSHCTTCQAGYYHMCDSCVDKCPSGFYNKNYNGVRECLMCHPSCKECSSYGPFSCLSCPPESNLIHNSCIPCLDGEFFNTNTEQCEKCHDNCGACYGPLENQCLTCLPPLRLHESRHECLHCCHKETHDCCLCSKDLDICIVNQSVFNFNITSTIPEDDKFSKGVLPIVIGISSAAVIVFLLLFLVLQYGSRCFNYRFKTHYACDFSASFDTAQEKISLTREDFEDDDDEISEKI